MFKKEWELKLVNLSNQRFSNKNSQNINKLDLLSIVLPEYVVYNEEQNEMSLIKSFYELNYEKYKSISFGPFQMQILFINKCISDSDVNELKNEIFIKCKEEGISSIIKNINHYSKIYVQWELLKLFEINSRKINKKITINELRRLYNSGDTNYRKGSFTKIKCRDLLYEEWCDYFSQKQQKLKK